METFNMKTVFRINDELLSETVSVLAGSVPHLTVYSRHTAMLYICRICITYYAPSIHNIHQTRYNNYK